MSSPTRLSFILTVRAVDTYRVENCIAVIRWYQARFPRAEFILVEQAVQSDFSSSVLPDGVELVAVHNPGAFNKAWGINVGFRKSTGDVLVITDADMLVDSTDMQRSIDAVAAQLHVVRPYRQLIDMNPEETRRFHLQGILPDAPDADRGFDRGYLGEHICLAGGLFIIRRQLFETVGGFDERFRGWGGEDDAFSLRVEAATALSAIARKGNAWHLWHPRQADRHNADYRANLALLEAYQRWRAGVGDKPAAEPLARIGDTGRYRNEPA